MNSELLLGYPAGSRLVADYLAGHPGALAFFQGDPSLAASYQAAAEGVATRFDRTARVRAVEVVHAPTSTVRARLGRLVDEGGFFVTTGQQPGLFTGPLYSVYKALSAVRLAETLEQQLGKPVVPLFWVASEDHDWTEVDHTYTVSVGNELRRLGLDGAVEHGDRSIHRVTMGDAVAPVLEEFLALSPDNDFKAECARQLRSAYSPDNTMGQAFTEVLAQWFGPLGMAFVDAAALPLKDASRALLTSALDESVEHETLLGKSAERLRGAGYHVQVPILPHGVNLFLEGGAGRERVYRSGRGFRLRHSGERLTRRQVLDRASFDRRALSPNVLLRPVVESTVFPVISYVAGPGEIAYFAQLAELFESCGVRMPVIRPRFAVTVIEPKIRKVLDKLNLSLQDLARPYGELAGEVVREDVPPAVHQALDDLRRGIGRGVDRLSHATAILDPTLKGPAKHVRTVAFDALEHVRRKVIHSLKREKHTTLRQLEKAQLHLYPRGGSQERSLNAYYYLARYGGEFLQALHDRFSVRLADDGMRGAGIARIESLQH